MTQATVIRWPGQAHIRLPLSRCFGSQYLLLIDTLCIVLARMKQINIKPFVFTFYDMTQSLNCDLHISCPSLCGHTLDDHNWVILRRDICHGVTGCQSEQHQPVSPVMADITECLLLLSYWLPPTTTQCLHSCLVIDFSIMRPAGVKITRLREILIN